MLNSAIVFLWCATAVGQQKNKVIFNKTKFPKRFCQFLTSWACVNVAREWDVAVCVGVTSVGGLSLWENRQQLYHASPGPWAVSCFELKHCICVLHVTFAYFFIKKIVYLHRKTVCMFVSSLTRRQCSAMLCLRLHPWPRWSRWPAVGPSPPPCGLGEPRPAVQSCLGS